MRVQAMTALSKDAMVERLMAPEWLERPLVQKVTAALGPAMCRFVGGAVRDTALGLPVNDIDMASVHRPQVVKTMLNCSDIRVLDTGLAHGTVTALGYGDQIEITTLRADVETDGRHAQVAFTDNWFDDASRRDFTVNALYLSQDGTLYDPYDGLEDLRQGIIRFIGDPAARIDEDYLRILRYVRFLCSLSHAEPDPKVMRIIAEKRNDLSRLSRERIISELAKILLQDSAIRALDVFAQLELSLDGLLTAGVAGALQRLLNYEKSAGTEAAPDRDMRLSVLYLTSDMPMAEWRRLAKVSNAQVNKFERAKMALDMPTPETLAGWRALAYNKGRFAAQMAARLAGDLAVEPSELETLLANWQSPLMPVDGDVLFEAGFEPGPTMGRVLGELEAQWVASDFTLGRQDLLALAASFLSA